MGTSKLSGKPDEMLGVTSDGLASHPGGVTILLVASCYRNPDKLRQLMQASLFFYNSFSKPVMPALFIIASFNNKQTVKVKA